MTTQEIYELSIKLGTRADLRGKKAVEKYLEHTKKRYAKLSSEEKKSFDKERLNNPYSDSRIHNLAKARQEVKKVLVGIDIDVEELLLAQHLDDIDLVIAHHPEGRALADLSEVMDMQAEILAGYGIPINVAEGLLEERISEVNRGVAPVNHYKVVDAARLLDISFMNLHTTCDNLVAKYLEDLFKKEKPEYVSDVMDLLHAIPEYDVARKQGSGPSLFAGKPSNRTGRIAMVEVTGGTAGSAKMYEKAAAAGIGTIVGMHMSEKHLKEAKAAHVNAIIAGHISSDSLGVNLFMDELEKKGIEIVPCGGYIRVSRVKKGKKRVIK